MPIVTSATRKIHVVVNKVTQPKGIVASYLLSLELLISGEITCHVVKTP